MYKIKISDLRFLVSDFGSQIHTMDDILVYLIFIAFAILSRILTKKKEPQGPPSGQGSDYSDDRPQRPQKQVSFEDLLKEFTGEAEKQQHRPVPVEEPTRYKSYEDDKYEVENYEEQYERDEEAKKVYQRSVRQAKKLKTIDEQVDFEKMNTKLAEVYDPYHEKKKDTIADDIRKQLQNPEQVKRAVILSEILNRKY